MSGGVNAKAPHKPAPLPSASMAVKLWPVDHLLRAVLTEGRPIVGADDARLECAITPLPPPRRVIMARPRTLRADDHPLVMAAGGGRRLQ